MVHMLLRDMNFVHTSSFKVRIDLRNKAAFEMPAHLAVGSEPAAAAGSVGSAANSAMHCMFQHTLD